MNIILFRFSHLLFTDYLFVLLFTADIMLFNLHLFEMRFLLFKKLISSSPSIHCNLLEDLSISFMFKF